MGLAQPVLNSSIDARVEREGEREREREGQIFYLNLSAYDDTTYCNKYYDIIISTPAILDHCSKIIHLP